MNWEAFSAIADVVGALAVVISLVYVARQVRASMEQSISDRLSENMMMASSSDMGLILIRGLDDISALDKEEEARFIFYLSGYLRTMEQAHRQYTRGFLDRDIWAGYEAYLRVTSSSPSMKLYWADRRKIFNSKFRTLVDEMTEQAESNNLDLISELTKK